MKNLEMNQSPERVKKNLVSLFPAKLARNGEDIYGRRKPNQTMVEANVAMVIN
jgi:hypothetical protein